MSVLEVNHMSVNYMTGDFKGNYYETKFEANHDITFSLDKGEMIGIIGSKSAGQSTLLKVITGILKPTRGSVSHTGNVAALLELESAFDGDSTVRENTYLRGTMHGYTRRFMDEIYGQIIAFAELEQFQNRPFKQLSSKMKYRLAFSIASLVQPDILILDEVLSAGDVTFCVKSEAKLKEIIASGTAAIFVSHSLARVRNLCGKVLWMEKGHQIAFGDTTILCDLYQQFLDKKISLERVSEIWAQLNQRYDYLIVGSGLFGSVFAREATDCGKQCMVIDRRTHLGGNVYCEEINGIIVHKYGAHIFHTNRKDVWNYLNRFVVFMPYTHRVCAYSGGECYSLPFNMKTFHKLWGIEESEAAKKKIEGQRLDVEKPNNLEEQALALVGSDIYETLIKDYTEKQWGRACTALPADIIRRIPLRFESDDRYFSDTYQGIPEGGYNHLIEGLLEGTVTICDMSFEKVIHAFPNIATKIVYTGSIDQFFQYQLGKLEYRSLRFETMFLDEVDYQGAAVINYCDCNIPYTRIIEHKHFSSNKINGTVVTKEYPEEWSPGKEAYYPIPDERNRKLYQRYLELAENYPNVIFGGRLGEYRYYNMDQTVAAALTCAAQELQIGIAQEAKEKKVEE